MEIKDILYNSIENHKEYIVSDIAQGKSSEIIETICKECFPALDKFEGNKSEILGGFAESLMHYLLTTALIPSQRKFTINNTYVDVLIPDTKTLYSNPQDALIIIFPKSSDVLTIKNRIDEITKIQPNKENLWFVLQNDFPEVKTYSFDKNTKNSFSNILNDIIGFLTNKKQSKLRLFRI